MGRCLVALMIGCAAADCLPAPAFAAEQPPWAQWNELTRQRQQIISRMNQLRDQQQATQPGQPSAVNGEWESLGQQLSGQIDPALSRLAEAIYAAQPSNTTAAYFALLEAHRRLRFERSAQIADSLIQAGRFNQQVLQMAAESHFASHHFLEAGQYWRRLAQAGPLDRDSQAALEATATYPARWTREQLLRRREAAAGGELLLPRVVLKTDKGELELELFENEAPLAVRRLVSLVESHAYDGLSFSGSPSGYVAVGPSAVAAQDLDDGPLIPTLAGGGDSTQCECFAPQARDHFRDSVTLECLGRESYGQELRIAWKPIPPLNADVPADGLFDGPAPPGAVTAHTVLGRVIRGADTIALLLDRAVLQSAAVVRKRSHAYETPQPQAQPHQATLLEEGRFSQAVQQAQQRWEDVAASSGATSADALAAANQLGLALLARNDWAEAAQRFQRVWEGRRATLGEAHALTAQALNNLGVAQYRQGRYGEAQESLERALAIREQVLGPDHFDTIQSLASVVRLRNLSGGELDWDRFGQACERLLNQFAQEEAGRSPDSADLFELEEDEIRHPTLKMSLAFPAAGYDVLEGKAIPLRASVARNLWQLGQLNGEHSALKAAAAVTAAVFGPEHFQTALALNNLAAHPRYPFGEPQLIPPQADPVRIARLKYALEIVSRIAGENHAYTAAIRHNLGICLLSDRQYEQAEIELETAWKICLTCYGPQHARTAFALETLGLARYVAGDFRAAAVRLEQAAELRRQTLGGQHPLTAAALNSLGAAWFEAGDYPAARRRIEEALELRRAALGGNHRLTNRSLNDLGVVLKTQGDYATARRYLETAIEQLRRLPLEQQTDLPVLESNLWALRLEMGDLEPAKRSLLTALHDSPDDLFVRQNALANLGAVAQLEGKPAEARGYLQQALANDPENDALLNSLGAVAREEGNLAAAQQYFAKAYKHRRDMFGEDHPQVAFTMISFGLLEQRRGDFQTAERWLTAALAIYEKHYGRRNPKTTDVLRLLGENALLSGRAEDARRWLQEALSNKLRLADDILPTLSEAEALAFVLAWDERDLLLDALARSQDPPASEAYDAVWNSRALATRAIAARRQDHLAGEAAELAAQLRAVRKSLAAIILSHRSSSLFDEPPEASPDELLALSERKEQLQRELVQLSPADRLRQQTDRVDWRDLLDQFPAATALVDIVQVGKPAPGSSAPTAGGQRTYEAFVLKAAADQPGGRGLVQWISLGSAEPIDAAVAQWRSLIRRGNGGVTRDAPSDTPPSTLRRLVWQKLEPQLGGVRTIIITPDGALTRLPWSALPGREPGQYLIEQYAIATAAYPAQIASLLQSPPPTGDQWLLVGGVAYDRKPESAGLALASSSRGVSGDVRGRHWQALPGTLEEVRRIAELAPQPQSLVRLEAAEAGESRLQQQLPRSRFAHLATHGFFADASQFSAWQPAPRRDSQLTSQVQQLFRNPDDAPACLASVVGRNPLTLSGLVLAGANQPPSLNAFGAPVGDDGVLTAEEVAGMDLSQTELVVLSACETGLGEVAGGEGVFGLQRAFALAGARSVVGSLWPVGDQATQILMTEFYRELWWKSQGKLQALRNAQRTMIRRYDPEFNRLWPTEAERPADSPPLPPFYWAAFTLSGDWR